MTDTRAWRLVRRAGPAAELHRWRPPSRAERVVEILDVAGPALVLGSAQPDDIVDREETLRRGVSVVRRGSGGGAVLLVPGRHVWVDLWLPGGDPLRTDDVVRGADWAGAAWAAALAEAGLGELVVHRGRLVGGGWAELVCFAGRGPGEVFAGARKVVGVSQRRTREWLRVQTLIHREWDAAATVAVLAGPEPTTDELAELQSAVAGIGMVDVVAALEAALPG